MQVLWGQWLKDVETRGVFTPVGRHDCKLSQCPLRRIPLYYCTDGKPCMGESPPTMGWLQRTAVFFERGGQPQCTNTIHQRLISPSETAIFFCFTTGTPHLCGTTCDRTVVNSDGGIVCTLTGQVVEVSRVTTGLYGDPDVFVSRAPKDTREFSNANLVSRAVDFLGSVEHIPRLEKNYSSFWGHALIHIMGFLSPQRFEHEAQEMEKRTEELNTRLERCIGNKQQHIDILQLLLLSVQHRKKYTSTMRISIDSNKSKELSKHYADIVISLWGILRLRVPGGEQMTKRGAFKDFIVASLELYKTGIVVRDRSDRYDVQLLSPDPILSIVGISEHAKEIALAKRVSNKNIARLRKGILTLLQGAISTHSVSPECLRICEIAELNSQLPDSAFD